MLLKLINLFLNKFYTIFNIQINNFKEDVMQIQSWGGIAFEDLTEPQKSFLKSVLENHDRSQILTGCAGSGKTIIAAHAISILQENTEKKVGFVVFTKLLRKFVEDGFQNSSLADNIYHYHDSHFSSHYYDLLIVDEAQDFEKSWIENVKANSKNQIWMGDSSQQIYEDALNEDGFSTLAQKTISKTHLDTNYRNSLFTAKFASYFMTLNSDDIKKGLTLNKKVDDFIKPILNNPLQSSSTNNQPAILIEAETPNEEYNFLASEIEKLSSQKTDSKKIAVAHFTNSVLDQIGFELGKRNISFIRVPKEKHLKDLPDFSENNLVVLSPMHSLKGLEFDYVFFPRSDFEPWKNQAIRDNLLFVLFTRAKKRVYSSWSNRNASVVWEKISGIKESDFFELKKSNAIGEQGIIDKPKEDIEKIIKKHFEDFNI